MWELLIIKTWESVLAITNSAFLIQMLSTFMGGILAFFSGWLLYQKQKKDSDVQKKDAEIAELHFSLTSLSTLLQELYSLKKQMLQPRYEECLHLEKKLQKEQSTPHEIQQLSTYIYAGSFEYPIEHRHIYSVSSMEPQLISLSLMAENTLKTLKKIIHDVNIECNRLFKNEKSLSCYNKRDLQIIIIYNKALYKNLDYTIYLVELLIDVLIRFGHIKCKKSMKFTKFEIGDEYKKLRPKPIESWHNYNWFPEKKKWWHKISLKHDNR